MLLECHWRAPSHVVGIIFWASLLHQQTPASTAIKSTSRQLYVSITAAILWLGVTFMEQMGVNFKLSGERAAASGWQWGWPAWCLIKRHVDLSEAPGGAETRSHLTACESEPSHYGPNLSIYPGAFFYLVRREKIKCHGFVEETHALRKTPLKGKCRRVNVEYWKVFYGG